MSISYGSTSSTPSGQKLAEHIDTALTIIDEAATLKQLVQDMTKQPNHTTPAAGQNKKMLEIAYAANAIECTVDQSVGGSPGNVIIGDIYEGDVTGFQIRVDVQDDQGSQSHMQCTIVTGTPVEGELMTNTGSNTNTGRIATGTLVSPTGNASLGTKTGGGNGKYEGEVQFGAETGAGDDLYDAVVAWADGAVALRDEAVKLFQGG